MKIKPNTTKPLPRRQPLTDDDDLSPGGFWTYALGTFLVLANLYTIYIMVRELCR